MSTNVVFFVWILSPCCSQKRKRSSPRPSPTVSFQAHQIPYCRMETLFWVLGDRRGPSNLSKAEKLGPGPVVGMPNPTEDVAGTWKGGICPSHPYFVPWVALETKGCVDG